MQSVLGVFPKTLDPDLYLPNVWASEFNIVIGVSAVHLPLLLNLSGAIPEVVSRITGSM